MDSQGTHGNGGLFSGRFGEVLSANRQVYAQGPFFLYAPLPEAPKVAERTTSPLTEKMSEALQMLADGIPIKDIAWKLGINKSSVEFRLRAARRRTRSKTSSQLIAVCIRNGWIR